VRHRNAIKFPVCWLAACVVLAIPETADAHAIGAEAKLKGETVSVEAFYDDNTPAADAKINVTDQAGVAIGEGRTDAKGVWTFPAPPPGQYKIAVDAGAGHRTSVALTIPAAVATPGPPGDEPVTVSEGPTRTEFTGPMRLLWATIGLAIIGGGTWVLTRVMRALKARPAVGEEA
jgi:nickel transport protein